MAQGTISKEKIDETFANRFKDTFKDIIEERRFQNSQLSADGKPVGKKYGCTHKELAMEAGVNEKTVSVETPNAWLSAGQEHTF